jgi:hypothetical protein
MNRETKILQLLSFRCIVGFFVFFGAQSGLPALYRPYETHLADAVSAATGGCGGSSVESIQSISQNPSFLAGIKDASVSFGFEGVFGMNSFLNYPRVRFDYFPQIAFDMPAQSYGSTGFMTFTSFQNQDSNFAYTLYNFEGIYSARLFDVVDFGFSAGAGMAFAKDVVTGGGFTYSFSALYRNDFFSTGLLIRPGANLEHSVYNGFHVFERTPTRVQGGLTSYFKNWSLILELDYVDWRNSTFVENSMNVAPEFESGFIDFLHPHVGGDIALRGLLEMNLRFGAYTSDSFDFRGANSRQIYFTGGIRVLAGSSQWKNKLKIDLSYESGFLPALFWSENRQVESVKLTLEYVI